MFGDNLPLPRTGLALKNDFDNYTIVNTPIAEGFLYEKKIHMLFADPGAGKSTIGQQIAMEVSKGLPVFRSLECPRPFRTYYIQLEGDYSETIERGRHMLKSIDLSYDRLTWDEHLVGIDVSRPEHIEVMINRIRTAILEPELIIIDPIYQAISGDISKMETATAYCRFSSVLQKTFDCALLHIHHTPKEMYSQQTGDKVERQSYYGSQWFMAHMNSIWYLKTLEKKAGRTCLYNKKQRNSNMLSEIPLHFDVESHTVYLEQDPSNMSCRERVTAYLRRVKVPVSVYDIIEECKLSHAQLRRINEQLFKAEILEKVRDKSGKNLYKLRQKE